MLVYQRVIHSVLSEQMVQCLWNFGTWFQAALERHDAEEKRDSELAEENKELEAALKVVPGHGKAGGMSANPRW